MNFPLPITPENVGVSIAAVGLIGNPPTEFVFDKALIFPAASAEDVVIATLANPISGEALSFTPADGRIKWVGSVLKVGATSSAAGTRYYVLTRTKDAIAYSQTVAVQAV